jgi:hypothetical protein
MRCEHREKERYQGMKRRKSSRRKWGNNERE